MMSVVGRVLWSNTLRECSLPRSTSHKPVTIVYIKAHLDLSIENYRAQFSPKDNLVRKNWRKVKCWCII